jgi:hypothetical protein
MSQYLNILAENNMPTVAEIRSGHFDGVEYSKNGRCTSVLWTVGDSSAKLAKSISSGDVDGSVVLYLEAGYFCPWMTRGCAAKSGNSKGKSPCLRTAGRLGMPTGQLAGLRRTLFYIHEEENFMNQAVADFVSYCKSLVAEAGTLAEGKKLLVSVRLDGTSDIGQQWNPLRRRLEEAVLGMPIQPSFYEYTKNWKATLKVAAKDQPYSITLSRHENTTMDEVQQAISLGYCVAVVIDHTKAKPDTLWGIPTIDGDLSDYRPNDKAGHIVLLHAKGNMKADTTGFVVRSW